MRISDWSSDVCSSDLVPCAQIAGNRQAPETFRHRFKHRHIKLGDEGVANTQTGLGDDTERIEYKMRPALRPILARDQQWRPALGTNAAVVKRFCSLPLQKRGHVTQLIVHAMQVGKACV